MTTLPEDDEFTRLIDAQFDRVDLVKTGANGAPRFLVAKQDSNPAGLLEPGYVRGLIAKAEPEPAREDSVTMTGSPAAIAALIHNASVAKEKNDTADRKKKASSGAAMPDGSYPIADEGDLTKAIHAVGRGGSSHNAIRKHIISRARSLGASSKIPDNWNSDGSLKGDSVSKADPVAKDAGDMLDAQTDDGVDGMDPTVPLAAPEDGDAPGDPTDPGSPAWEAIDAATAQKWCSILSRARVALDLLSERELLEAASADPDDAENAWDLQDACCAIDYVVGVLAPYAVAEQSEADCGADELMAAVGKAMAGFEDVPLERIEGLARIAKAGRVLSSANEALIRNAGESLQKVLASLPQAPLADDTVTKETAMAADETKPAGEPQDVAKETGQPESGLAAGLTAELAAVGAAVAAVAKDAQEPAEGQEDVAKAGLQVAVYDKAGAVCLVDPSRISEQIAKADAPEGKAKMVAVFDSKGDLVGVCDPGDITPIAGADAPAANEEEPPAADKPAEPAAPADPADLTAAPSADAGTPADDVAKGGQDNEDPQAVLKSIVTDAMSALLDERERPQEVRKADLDAALEEIRVLKERLETVENTPAMPRVFTSGATPPPGTLRGQDAGAAAQVDVAKAQARKAELYAASGPDQARIAKEMTEQAGAVYEAMRAAR